MSHSEVFGNIYSNNVWGDGSQLNPKSGSGSNPKNARPYVSYVKNFISNNEITSILDFGHGDWKMWEHYKFEGVQYLGIDVADGLSAKIHQQWGSKLRQFRQLDITHTRMPNAELLLSKDVLQHLPTDTVLLFLSEIKKFKYAIVCNDVYIKGTKFFEFKEFLQLKKRIIAICRLRNPFFLCRRKNNRKIKVGEFRGIDLNAEPFRTALKEHKVEIVFEYDGPFRPGIKKRVYLISLASIN